MCELFTVSSSTPVRLRYSLHAFAEHGGLLHPNKSGWGIAYREGWDVLLIKEPKPASDSPWVRFIESQPMTSTCIVAHVRYATAGLPSFANTHPFMRELGGRMHVFAHNGSIAAMQGAERAQPGPYKPVGDTDSERAFCLLLARLTPLWQHANGPPPLNDRLHTVAEVAANLRTSGTANFLYWDGDVLFVHAHERRWDEGDGKFSEPRPPGLSLARRSNLMVKGLQVNVSDPDTSVIYIASVPLTDDGWEPLPEGTVLALRDGEELARAL